MADVDAPAPADAEETPIEMPPEIEKLFGVPVTHSVAGQVVLHPSRAELIAVIKEMRTAGYWQCLDLAAVDYLSHPDRSDLPFGVEPERFEIVVLLINHSEGLRARLRVQIPESDPTCPSLFTIHPGTEAPEREAFDLMGISFDGHPDMTRILMPDGWDGHPLRKDYAIGRIPVQFKAASS